LHLLDEGAQAAVILRGYRATRLEFGVNRIHLGAHLHLIKEHKLWKGISETWEEFLAMENINPNAARQYISVAKKFVYELDIDDETLRKLSMAGISALEKAGRVINDSNKEEIMETLMSLSERDAIQRIIEISSGVDDNKPQQPTMRVLRILKEYHELPPDLQQDFRHRLGSHEDTRRRRNGGDEASGKSPAVPEFKRDQPLPVASRSPVRFRSAAQKKTNP
jgi:hypothetical protein